MTVQSGLADADSRGRGNGAPQAGGAEVSPGGCFGGGGAARYWDNIGMESSLRVSTRMRTNGEDPACSAEGTLFDKLVFFKNRFIPPPLLRRTYLNHLKV